MVWPRLKNYRYQKIKKPGALRKAPEKVRQWTAKMKEMLKMTLTQIAIRLLPNWYLRQMRVSKAKINQLSRHIVIGQVRPRSRHLLNAIWQIQLKRRADPSLRKINHQRKICLLQNKRGILKYKVKAWRRFWNLKLHHRLIKGQENNYEIEASPAINHRQNGNQENVNDLYITNSLN